MKSNETKKRREQVLRASLNGISCFLSDYIKKNNALDYIYEGDVQAALYNSIKSNLEKCKLNYGEEEWIISKRSKQSKEFTTKKPCLVHCEQWYKSNGKGRGKAIDIAVWDPSQENAGKHYANKDLLLLIEIKYRSLAKWAIEAVKKDYKKLQKILVSGNWPKGLALTFCADCCKNFTKKAAIDPCDVLKRQPIQALVACRDGVIEIQI